MGTLLLALSAAAGADLRPIDYELKAVEYRRQIRTAHIEAVIKNDTPIPKLKTPFHYAARLEAWQDGSRHRSDEWPVAGWPARTKGSMRLVHCRGCLPDGKWVRYSQPTSIVLDRPGLNDEAISRELQDLRRIGHSLYGLLTNRTLAGNLASPEIDYRSAERVTFKGEDAVLIRGVYVKYGFHRRCWIAPAKGYSLLRLETSEGPEVTPEQPIGGSVETELAQDAASGVWFPKRVRMQSFDKGELHSEETIEVKVAEFNRPLDPAAFSLKGMGLTPGTPVIDTLAAATPLFWSGEAVTRTYSGPIPPEMLSQAIPAAKMPAADADPPTQPADPTRTPWWVYLLAGVLGVVGCGLLVLARRR